MYMYLPTSQLLRANAGESNAPSRSAGILSASVTRDKSATAIRRMADKGAMRQGLCRNSRSCIEMRSSFSGSIMEEAAKISDVLSGSLTWVLLALQQRTIDVTRLVEIDSFGLFSIAHASKPIMIADRVDPTF
jgi:hypothetical protein